MLHLSADRLAELGDDTPTSAEHAHVAECAPCARELDAYVALAAMARAEGDTPGIPLSRWEGISAAMAAELPSQFASDVPFRVQRERATVGICCGTR